MIFIIALWESRSAELLKSNIKLINPVKDLIDEIWPSDERAYKPNSLIKVHKFPGKTISYIDYFDLEY